MDKRDSPSWPLRHPFTRLGLGQAPPQPSGVILGPRLALGRGLLTSVCRGRSVNFTLQVAIRTAFKGPQRVSPVLEASHGAPRAAQQAGSGPQCEHMWILNTDVATGYWSPGFANMKRVQGPERAPPWARPVGFQMTRWKAGVCPGLGPALEPSGRSSLSIGVRTDKGPPCLDTKDRGKVDREGPPPLHREDGRGRGPRSSLKLPEGDARESGNSGGRREGIEWAAEWGLTARSVATRSPGSKAQAGDPGSA